MTIGPWSFDDGVELEFGDNEALKFKVEGIYDSTGTLLDTHGIWLEFQKNGVRSDVIGPIALSFRQWIEIKEYTTDRMWDDR